MRRPRWSMYSASEWVVASVVIALVIGGLVLTFTGPKTTGQLVLGAGILLNCWNLFRQRRRTHPRQEAKRIDPGH